MGVYLSRGDSCVRERTGEGVSLRGCTRLWVYTQGVPPERRVA